jgi:hypothetical protein
MQEMVEMRWRDRKREVRWDSVRKYDETELPKIMGDVLGARLGKRVQIWKIEENSKRRAEERQVEPGIYEAVEMEDHLQEAGRKEKVGGRGGRRKPDPPGPKRPDPEDQREQETNQAETVTLSWREDTVLYEWERLAGRNETRLERIFRKRFKIPENEGIAVFKREAGGEKRRAEKKQVEPGEYEAGEDDWAWVTLKWKGREGERQIHRSTKAADIFEEIRKQWGIPRQKRLRLRHWGPLREGGEEKALEPITEGVYEAVRDETEETVQWKWREQEAWVKLEEIGSLTKEQLHERMRERFEIPGEVETIIVYEKVGTDGIRAAEEFEPIREGGYTIIEAKMVTIR